MPCRYDWWLAGKPQARPTLLTFKQGKLRPHLNTLRPSGPARQAPPHPRFFGTIVSSRPTPHLFMPSLMTSGHRGWPGALATMALPTWVVRAHHRVGDSQSSEGDHEAKAPKGPGTEKAASAVPQGGGAVSTRARRTLPAGVRSSQLSARSRPFRLGSIER